MRGDRSRVVIHALKERYVMRPIRITAGDNVRESNCHRWVRHLSGGNPGANQDEEYGEVLHLLSNYRRLPGTIVKSCARNEEIYIHLHRDHSALAADRP